jgi:hypothetical protein
MPVVARQKGFFMKRTVVLLFAVVLLGASLSAQQKSAFVGFKGGAGIAFNSFEGGNEGIDSTMPFFGGAELGFDLGNKVAVVVEADFLLNQGGKTEEEGYTVTYTFPSLDIPVLLRYTLSSGKTAVALQAGPYLALPFALKAEAGGASLSVDPDGIVFGVTGGLFVGAPVGKGRLFGDLRVQLDLSDVKFKNMGAIGKRRDALLGIGYELPIG